MNEILIQSVLVFIVSLSIGGSFAWYLINNIPEGPLVFDYNQTLEEI